MHQITLLGPLSLELDLKVRDAAILAGDAHLAKHRGAILGGPLLRTARLLRTIGHNASLCSYLGNDAFGNQIIDLIKDEGIEANIQKIPNISTPIMCKLSDKKDCTYYITETKDLDLWQFRLQSLPDSGIIYIDPAVPTEMHLKIIKQFKNAIIIVRRPLDRKLDIYDVPKKLIVLLNEYEVFQLFGELSYGHFCSEKILKLDAFANHTLLVEAKDAISCLNEHGRIMQICLQDHRHNYAMLDEFFLTGVLAGLASQQTYMNAFVWGLVCSMQNGRNQPLNKLDILAKSAQLTWNESSINELP